MDKSGTIPLYMNADQPDPYSATIAALEAEVAKLLVAIDTLQRQRAMRTGEPLPIAARQAPNLPGPPSPEAIQTFEDSKVLAKAGINQLDTANCPMTAREIEIALVRAGAKFVSRDPSNSINVALKAHGAREVILTGFGKWGLRKWFTASEIEELESRWGGLGGRSRDTHAARTRDAIKEKIARGEAWGKRRRVTAQHMAKAYEALRKGGSKSKAAREAEISMPTFYFYWRRFQMEDWRPDLPWPPPRREVEIKGPFPKNLMWSPENSHSNGKEPQMFSAAPPELPGG